VDLVTAVEGAFRTEEASGLVDAIIGDSEDSIVALLIISLGRELSLFLLLLLSVVIDTSAIMGRMIYMTLTWFPVRV